MLFFKKFDLRQALYWFICFCLISTLDWIEHIMRDNSIFENIALKWFLYSLSNTFYIYFLAIVVYILLFTIFKKRIISFILELTAVLFAFWTFQFVGQSILDIYKIEIHINFNFNVISLVILGLLFSLLWLVYHKIRTLFTFFKKTIF